MGKKLEKKNRRKYGNSIHSFECAQVFPLAALAVMLFKDVKERGKK